MNIHGLELHIHHQPALDPDFIPLKLFQDAYRRGAQVPVQLALERPDGITACEVMIHGGAACLELDCYYMDRVVKNLLWQKGGHRLYVCGSKAIYVYLRDTYSIHGARGFDSEFMRTVYGRALEVRYCRPEQFPQAKESARTVGGYLDGCRIGLDVGGSAKKMTAMMDGEVVYSENLPWDPIGNTDWRYHQREITAALQAAAGHLPRVDAIGVSSAGVFVENEARVASIFRNVPQDDFGAHLKTVFLDAARAVADVPCAVCNDGDVGALAAGMDMGCGRVLGISMGTSEAAGYLDARRHITGWLNELAFASVDVSPCAPRDDWSGDIGVGSQYFSQAAVLRLAQKTAIAPDAALTPAQGLREIQGLMAAGHPEAARIYASIGVYLGHTLALYHDMYEFQEVLLMGGVLSGPGGNLILERGRQVLDAQYPQIASRVTLRLPAEQTRRIGQSVAAASLPRVIAGGPL